MVQASTLLCFHFVCLFFLKALVASEGVADAFNSQTVALTNSQDSSRTFYMVASSEQERHAWTDAINENIDAYKVSTVFKYLITYAYQNTQLAHIPHS